MTLRQISQEVAQEPTQAPIPVAFTLLAKAILYGIGIGIGLYIVRKKMKLE